MFSFLYLKVELIMSHVNSFLIRMIILFVVLVFDKESPHVVQAVFQLKILSLSLLLGSQATLPGYV